MAEPERDDFEGGAAAAPAKGDALAGTDYGQDEGRFVWIKATQAGVEALPLSNFLCSIDEAVVVDDGSGETRRFFSISGILQTGQPLSRIRVASEKFQDLGWVAAQWGPAASLPARQQLASHLRKAIETFSRNAPERRVVAHTGWRQIGSKWVFLTAAGATPETAGVEVELPAELQRYRLPGKQASGPAAATLAEAWRASLALLDVADDTITAPLWAAMFRAPLESLAHAGLTLWLVGPTGSYKSTLAALFLSHFGDFCSTDLPAGWASTAAGIERLLFLAKDLPLVVDDYAPSGAQAPVRHVAERAVRNQANRQARTRLRGNLQLASSYQPRALLVSTGEESPTSSSVAARTFAVGLRALDVDLKRLTAAQKSAALLPTAMGAFVEWCAKRYASLETDLPGRIAEIREDALRWFKTAHHPREPEMVAQLWVAAETAAIWAQQDGLATLDEAEALSTRIWKGLVESSQAVSIRIGEAGAGRRIVEALDELMAEKRVLLAERKTELPPPSRNGQEYIGWEDARFWYLLPNRTASCINRVFSDSDSGFTVSPGRLADELQAAGRIGRQADKGRSWARVYIAGKQRRVLAVLPSETEEAGPEEKGDPPF